MSRDRSLRVILLDCAGGKDPHVRRALGEAFTLLEASEETLSRLVVVAIDCDVAVVLLDLSKGLSPEIRRQVWRLAILGISRIVLAVNVDAVDHPKDVFAKLEGDARELAAAAAVLCVPISSGDVLNIERPASGLPWFKGPDLLECVAGADRAAVSEGGETSAAPSELANRFEATLVWAADRAMLQGRAYPIRVGEKTISATIAPLKYRIEIDTRERRPAKRLLHGEIGVCDVELAESVALAPYSQDRQRGSFTLVDPLTGEPAGVLLVLYALRRSQNLRWQAVDVDKAARARLIGQKPCLVWFTGLSGAGKSTIANLVERQLHFRGYHTYLLDGDNVRHGLNKDLGFTDVDRVENIRRVAEVARLMVDAGLIVLVSFISPFRSERRMARELVPDGEFFEVFVDTPLDVAEARDPKGLYRKARRGQLMNFTGIDSPYEPPDAPEVRLDTTRMTPGEGAQAVLDRLVRAGILDH